jgi:hypothetical protein
MMLIRAHIQAFVKYFLYFTFNTLYIEANGQTGKQANRQTGKQANRQTGKQANK